MDRRLRRIREDIRKAIKGDIECSERHSSIALEGSACSWAEVVRAGKIAANRGYKGVINDIEVPGIKIPDIKKPLVEDGYIENKKVDVLIIGGGITGCAIMRELSKWNISILLVEKEEDIGMHTSSRNDGMVHPGIEPRPGSRKAVYNVRGNELYSRITEELDVPFRRSGSIILFDRKWVRYLAPFVYSRAKRNGVTGMRFLSRDEVMEKEPYVAKNIAGGIFFPSTGVVSPYRMTIAYGENAVQNGAQISLNTIVLSMEREGDMITSVRTNRGTVHPCIVINAAGVYADRIAGMAGDRFFTIHPRKGEIVLLDKKKGNLVQSVVAKPDLKVLHSDTKGGGVVRTVEGNILVGPDAYEQPFREDYSTNRENINKILKKHLPIVPGLLPSDVIAYFAGIRAATYEEDFIVERSEYIKNLVHAAGIQSPGIASAPAIAEEIEKITCNILSQIMELKHKPTYNPHRRGIPELNRMDTVKRNMLIKQNPDYGVIVCRCGEISKGEIIDALRSPIPAATLDGVKRRTGAGMGRCQGGFCMPRVLDIIHEESGTDMLHITKKGGSSYVITDETKKDE